jgi:integrase
MASIVAAPGGFRAFVNRKGIKESKTFENKSEANAWAARREHEILSWTSPKQISKAHSLHKMLIRFRDEDSLLRPGAEKEKVRINRILTEIEDVPLAKLTGVQIAAWRNERLKVVLGSSVRRDMTMLKTIFETARRDWEWISVNPMADVKRPPDSPSRKRLISDEEIEGVIKALNYVEDGPVITVGQTIAVAFLIALETGMRAGELSKCVVVGKVAHLKDRVRKGDATKNGDEREVPLSLRARELFAKVGNKVSLNSGSLDTMFREARVRAGLGGFVFHDARHCACTRLAKKLQPMDLAKMMGHRNLKQTLEYYNPKTEDLADLLG